MILHLLLDAALVSGLGPSALVVLSVHVVLEGAHFEKTISTSAEDTTRTSVDEKHAPRIGRQRRR
jgi:hypothetical protein